MLKATFGASEDVAQDIRDSLNDRESSTAVAYNKSQMDTIQLIGITVALFATVTITSLQLPVLDNIHWTVSAVWTGTLVIVSFSVFTSFNRYRKLAGLTTTNRLRVFYMGLSPDVLAYRDSLERENKQALDGVEDFGPHLVANWIDIPRLLLYWTLMGYLLGLGLFWILQWKGPFDSNGLKTPETSRNVFIVFICILGVCTCYISFSQAARKLNDDIVGVKIRNIDG